MAGFTVHRAAVPSDGVPGFHQRDPRGVSAAGPALRDGIGKRIWRRGASMGNLAPRAGLPCTRPAPCRQPEDRLLFILAYVKTYSLQVVQGRLFSMGQSKANQCSTVVFWLRRGAPHLAMTGCLLGEQVAKDIFHPLPELEVLVGIQDHGLHECLGLLTTRFPNGFDGQAPFRQ